MCVLKKCGCVMTAWTGQCSSSHVASPLPPNLSPAPCHSSLKHISQAHKQKLGPLPLVRPDPCSHLFTLVHACSHLSTLVWLQVPSSRAHQRAPQRSQCIPGLLRMQALQHHQHTAGSTRPVAHRLADRGMSHGARHVPACMLNYVPLNHTDTCLPASI